MKVCLFGSYVEATHGIPSGNGGKLLKKILQSQDIDVVECHEEIYKYSSFIPAYIKLFFKHSKLDYDVIIFPWRSILTLPLAKLIHRKPMIYFPAFSIYDTLVNDRKKIKENSLTARFVRWVDKLACKMVDEIVLESTGEINYFVKEFDIPKKKFHRLPLGADESLFFPYPNNQNQNKFIVLYFGTFIPLHGVETIVKAAVILQKYEEILFVLCGDGQERPKISKLIQENNLKNIKMPGLVPREELMKFLRESNVGLGVFGSSKKARKVLTNKVYQILASKKPLITMDSPAAQEAYLETGVNCVLVPPSCPEKLAEAILFLKNNPEKCKQIAAAGYNTYVDHLSVNQVGKRLGKLIVKVLSEKVK